METEKNMTQTQQQTGDNAPVIVRKIGNTTFKVGIHFSKDSKETMNDKVDRLLRNELQTD